MRTNWKHTMTADYRSEFGQGIRPIVETTHPEGHILISELPRAKQAARRAYARQHDVPVSAVAAYVIYAPGMASVAHVVACVPDAPTY